MRTHACFKQALTLSLPKVPCGTRCLFMFSIILVNLYEIWTEKLSQTDLSLSGIKSCPSLYKTWLTTLTTFATFPCFTLKDKSISNDNDHIKSCKLSNSLGVYPKHRRNEVFFHVYFFHFGCFLIETVTTSTSVGMFYSIPQAVLFKWYIIWGLWAQLTVLQKCAISHGSERVKPWSNGA